MTINQPIQTEEETRINKVTIGDVSIQSTKLEANQLANLVIALLNEEIVISYLGFKNGNDLIKSKANYTG